jgi:hypothetical protein
MNAAAALFLIELAILLLFVCSGLQVALRNRGSLFALGISSAVAVAVGLGLNILQEGIRPWWYMHDMLLMDVPFSLGVNLLVFIPFGLWRVVRWIRKGRSLKHGSDSSVD